MRFFFDKQKSSQLQRLLFDLGSSPAVQAQWLGGDVGTSFNLDRLSSQGDVQTMWLFGDTFVGRFNASRNEREKGAAMPHSTVGIMTMDVENGNSMPPKMTFYVRRDTSGQPVSFFSPSSSANGSFWWVVSGVASSDGQQIVLLAQDIEQAPGCGLGFNIRGSVLISVSRPDIVTTNPLRWDYSSISIPNTSACMNWFVDITLAEDDSSLAYVVGQSAPIQQSKNKHNCTSCSPKGKIVLARSSITALSQLEWENDKTELWCKNGWSHICAEEDLQTLFDPGFGVSEISLVFLPRFQRWAAVLVRGFGGIDVDLWMSTDKSITSKWIVERSVFQIPIPPHGIDRLDSFSYAAKIHPVLARATQNLDAIVFSYATNTFNVSKLFLAGVANAVYTPQLVVLTPEQDNPNPKKPSIVVDISIAVATLIVVLFVGGVLTLVYIRRRQHRKQQDETDRLLAP